MPVIVVVYDRGAVSATEIAASLAGVADLVFAVPGTEYNSGLRPLLGAIGAVTDLCGDPAADAGRLREHAPDGILTFSEPQLRLTSELAARLGLPFHTPRAAGLLTDKYRQRQALNRAGTGPVRTASIAGPRDWWPALEQVGWPAVVKPVRGTASADTRLVTDPATARRVYAAQFAQPVPPGGLVAEEFLRGRPSAPYGDYVSVESIRGHGGTTHVAVTGKFPLEPPFREQGGFWPAVPAALAREEIPGLLDVVTRSLDALEVTVGLTHTEVKLTADGPRVIEVNGRLGGSIHNFSLRSGSADLVRANGLLSVGLPVDVKPAAPDRVHFQYIYLAPTRGCRLVATRGLRSLRDVPGITGFRGLASPGDRLGGVGTTKLGYVYGEAADHEAMLAAVDGALAALSFGFEGEDGRPFTLTRHGGQPTRMHD